MSAGCSKLCTVKKCKNCSSNIRTLLKITISWYGTGRVFTVGSVKTERLSTVGTVSLIKGDTRQRSRTVGSAGGETMKRELARKRLARYSSTKSFSVYRASNPCITFLYMVKKLLFLSFIFYLHKYASLYLMMIFSCQVTDKGFLPEKLS